MGSGFICVAGAVYTGIWGPYLENQYVRFALAGTTATVIVDFGLHGLDTLNMRSKAVAEASKGFNQSLFRPQAFFSLFRGATSIVYGIAPSAALYFYFYPQFRDHFYDMWRDYNQKQIEDAYEQLSKSRSSGH